MKWRTLAEQDGERTEVFEVPKRGCLVRVAVRAPDGFAPVTMTWCPGLRVADFETSGAQQAPSAAKEVPAPQPPEPAADKPGAKTPAPSTASADTADAKDVVELLRAYASMQSSVLAAFRSKVGVSSGKLGFLSNSAQVGGFPVQGHGNWVWRIDESAASMTSGKKTIEVPLPSHSRDDAFDPQVFFHYLKSTGHTVVGFNGAVIPVALETIVELMSQLLTGGVIRQFASRPRMVYILK